MIPMGFERLFEDYVRSNWVVAGLLMWAKIHFGVEMFILI